jgi:hypothetical protein
MKRRVVELLLHEVRVGHLSAQGYADAVVELALAKPVTKERVVYFRCLAPWDMVQAEKAHIKQLLCLDTKLRIVYGLWDSPLPYGAVKDQPGGGTA